MGFWSSLLKYGGKAAKGVGAAAAETGKTAGSAILHPTRTLRTAGHAIKAATVTGAVGYVGWEKLTSDKSVARIVSEAIVGKNATDTLAGTTDGMKALKEKAGAAMDTVTEAVSGLDGKLDGISNFLKETTSGGLGTMIGNFFGNLGRGNVSGLSIAGLVAAAFLVFGRFGWLGKIAGALLGMMLIGNNSGIARTPTQENAVRTQPQAAPEEEQVRPGGMRR